MEGPANTLCKGKIRRGWGIIKLHQWPVLKSINQNTKVLDNCNLYYTWDYCMLTNFVVISFYVLMFNLIILI